MKVLVTGANGQLGHDIKLALQDGGYEFVALEKTELDISSKVNVDMAFQKHKPDVVIHCAAYTKVDLAEDERDRCYAVNVIGTQNIVGACRTFDAKLVHFSTDYVFNDPSSEEIEVEWLPNPVNYYGSTKLRSEKVVSENLEKFFIIRTSWVFGVHGNNFVKTMLRISESKSKISVVSDQIGSPTYTPHLAKLVLEMIKTDKYGLYHVTNDGFCSWYEFACEIFERFNIVVDVNPIDSSQYPTRAKRPLNSRLSKRETCREWI